MSDTATLVRALRILARDIHCEDGIATQCITEAADAIERLRLTDEEREAIWTAMNAYGEHNDDEECAKIEATLYGVLERLRAEKAADWKAACESAELASKEITRLKQIIEDYAKITAASSREINGLLRINESLRQEIRTQRTEIAALREERRAVIESDRPWRNENPEGGWIP
jgi:hypothetical protein